LTVSHLTFRPSYFPWLDCGTGLSAALRLSQLQQQHGGKPLSIPVTGAVRDDADGSRWQSAELALAPLAPGDYLVELAAGNGRTLVAFRVIP